MPRHQFVRFLRDFYTAERAFLEREQLYGKGRADKFAQPAPPAALDPPRRDGSHSDAGCPGGATTE